MNFHCIENVKLAHYYEWSDCLGLGLDSHSVNKGGDQFSQGEELSASPVNIGLTWFTCTMRFVDPICNSNVRGPLILMMFHGPVQWGSSFPLVGTLFVLLRMSFSSVQCSCSAVLLQIWLYGPLPFPTSP